jgi:phosphoribosylglycinamide formyltransferase 2
VTASRRIGTPGGASATRLILLGSGELGREVAIEAIRLGCEVVACDRYAGAPAMAVAHRSHVLPMADASALRVLLADERLRPHDRLLVVPEIEAIATSVLGETETEGVEVVPTARAAQLTMDREGIRRLAAEELGLPTSPYRFCASAVELHDAVRALGSPCVVKPLMSSSGKGQSVVSTDADVEQAWTYAQQAGRVESPKVICEAFVPFDYELTLLTVRHAAGTSYCAPIGHLQQDGDYRESWQPANVTPEIVDRCHEIAARITAALGGHGIFGVELFVAGERVLFSEVSPRPHDTGLVTLASQELSEFALHVRAILGLAVPLGTIPLRGPAASAVVLGPAETFAEPTYLGLDAALLIDPSIDLRIFGKPTSTPGRRLGVCLAHGATTTIARERARAAAAAITIAPAS